MGVTTATRHIIWGRSGNLCAMCKMRLVHDNGVEAYPMGTIAHIEGDKPGSKRYRADMSETDRHAPSNLILLCPTDHLAIIDKDDRTYTVDKLHDIKISHESDIERQLQRLVPQVGFAELEVVLKYLIDKDAPSAGETLQVIPQKDKLKKNNLSNAVENLLRMGLMRKTEIDDYLNKNPDMNLSKRLRNTFVEKYKELRDSDLDSDGLFYALLDFATAGKDIKYEAAGLSIIGYYFHLCDVFEK